MAILCLVDKEAAAQAASPDKRPAVAREGARLCNEFRHQGAEIMFLAIPYVTPENAETLVQEGVPMLQLLRVRLQPWPRAVTVPPGSRILIRPVAQHLASYGPPPYLSTGWPAYMTCAMDLPQ